MRPFKHCGLGQSADFVLPSLVEQITEVAEVKRELLIRLANLDSVRNLSGVRDIVRGYRIAPRNDAPRYIIWAAVRE